jgi:hypothetical protein
MNPIITIKQTSELIVKDGFSSWKIHLFDFVDDFRRHKSFEQVKDKPVLNAEDRINALLASTVHILCVEQKITIPKWINEIPALHDPWFVSGFESLKPMAIVESPVEFLRKNVFVLYNFLSRV